MTPHEAEILNRFFGAHGLGDPIAELVDATHEKQRAFVLDDSERIVAIPGRRGGKTVGIKIRLVRALRQRGGISAYIALTRPTAERLMWQPLKDLNREYSLGLEFREQKLQVYDPTSGGELWLVGADDKREREKLRGHAFVEVAMDEAGSFGPYLSYLIDDVLDPALEDYGGTLLLVGTPPAACAGPFFEASTGIMGDRWSRHHWTVLDNSKFPRWVDAPDWQEQARAWLDRYMSDRGWDEDNPIFRREWLGEWYKDADSLVYKYRADRNAYDKLPAGVSQWQHLLGVDLGYDDATAFVVLAFSVEDPRAYVVEAWKRSGMIASEVAAEIADYKSKYNPRRIVVDSGGLGKMVVEEFKRRYSLPVFPAQKNAKFDYIEHLNADLIAGNLLIPRDHELGEEWSLLQWDENRRKEDERFENHLADACLYAWRESQHYRHRAVKPLPKTGSRAYYDAEAERMKREAIRRVQAQNRSSLAERLL